MYDNEKAPSLVVENHKNKLYCRGRLNVNVFKKQRKLLRNNFTLHHPVPLKM